MSRARVLVAVLTIGLVVWWLNWVRAGAAPSDETASPPAAESSGSSQPSASNGDTRPESAPAPTRGMDEIVSLDLRATDATDALKYLATKGGLNIAISKNVSGRVNLFLTDVPLRDVFDLILRSNELAYEKKGNVYNVMTEEEYRKLYGKKFTDLRQVRTFRLQYAIPQQAFNLLDTLKSEIGRILIDEDSGTVMIMDTAENLKQMEEALTTLERGHMVRIVDLKYAKAKDVEERLKDQLEVNKLGFVKADERTNQVIVKTFPARMKEVEEIINALDRKTREVLIDAKIIKIAYSDARKTGVDWDSIFSNLKFHGIEQQGLSGFGDFRNTTTGTAPSEVPAVNKIRIPSFSVGGNDSPDSSQAVKLGNLVFGTVARDGYELFRYLATIGDTKIISNPKLMVTENQEAKIHVGTKEAYVTTTTTTGQTTSTTAEDVQFIDVGIQLSVTPQINRDGYITMKIKPEVSSVVRTLTTPSKNQIPIVDTSLAETNVMVANGSTVVLGGLRKDQKQRTDKQVPYLGKIPLIGRFLFGQATTDDQLTELVVFITPHIMTGDQLITGDERASREGFKSFRDYTPLLSDQPSSPTASFGEAKPAGAGGGFRLKEPRW